MTAASPSSGRFSSIAWAVRSGSLVTMARCDAPPCNHPTKKEASEVGLTELECSSQLCKSSMQDLGARLHLERLHEHVEGAVRPDDEGLHQRQLRDEQRRRGIRHNQALDLHQRGYACTAQKSLKNHSRLANNQVAAWNINNKWRC